MTIFQSLILGIIQGLTEYLPVSSSAHLVIVPYLLKWSFPTEQIFPFDVLVQMGTLVAVILYFWNDLITIIKGFFRGLINKEPFTDPQARIGWYLIVATIPAGIIGMLIKSQVEAAFSSPQITAYFLFVTAALLILSDLVGKRTRQLEEMTWWDAIWIGLFQAISVFPGISRSGATITGGMTRNFDRTNSTHFSFLMAIPVMIGASLVSLKDLAAVPNLAAFLPILAIGFFAALIVGYLSIHWLLSFIKRQKFWYFAVYCVFLAGVVLTVSALRTTSAQAATSTSPAALTTAAATPLAQSSSDLQVIKLQYSNSLDWLTPTMTSCANLLKNTGLVTHSLPAQDLNLSSSDVVLRWGAPTNLSQTAYQIGSEKLALAVGKGNPLQTLQIDTARQVFNGGITTWGSLHTACPDCFKSYDSGMDAKTISLNFYPSGNDIQEIFLQKVMNAQPIATASALLIPDPASMHEILAGSNEAIGFLPAHLLDTNLKEVTLSGLDASQLEQPILAITASKPQGKINDWLLCLQKVLNP